MSLPAALLLGGFRQVVAGHHPVTILPGMLVAERLHRLLAWQRRRYGYMDVSVALALSPRRLRKRSAAALVADLERWLAMLPAETRPDPGTVAALPWDEVPLEGQGQQKPDGYLLAGWQAYFVQQYLPTFRPFQGLWSKVAPLIAYGM